METTKGRHSSGSLSPAEGSSGATTLRREEFPQQLQNHLQMFAHLAATSGSQSSILRPAVPVSLQKRLAAVQREARQLPRIRGPRERPTAGGTAKAIIFGGGHGVGERLSRRGKFGGFWKGKMQLLCNRSTTGGQELARILRLQCFPTSRVQLLCLIPRRHVIFFQLCSLKRFLANIPTSA